jgi:hypothetical protein
LLLIFLDIFTLFETLAQSYKIISHDSILVVIKQV